LRKKRRQNIGSGAGRHSAFVDTSTWIAFFSARDQNHFAAERLIRAAAAQKALLITTNLVLAEVHRLILHRVGPVAAALALERIESSAQVAIVFASGTHHAGGVAWLATLKNHSITYTDAVSFAVINDVGCAGFLSFDSDFLVAGFHPWLPA
jgi:predicted nucleic acid-binding protein